MKKRLLEITDPIHDFIQLNKTEHEIIDATQSKKDVHQDIMRVFSRKIGI